MGCSKNSFWDHKIVKSPYLNDKLSDFVKIWYTTVDLELADSHMTNKNIFKIQHGGLTSY